MVDFITFSLAGASMFYISSYPVEVLKFIRITILLNIYRDAMTASWRLIIPLSPMMALRCANGYFFTAYAFTISLWSWNFRVSANFLSGAFIDEMFIFSTIWVSFYLTLAVLSSEYFMRVSIIISGRGQLDVPRSKTIQALDRYLGVWLIAYVQRVILGYL